MPCYQSEVETAQQIDHVLVSLTLFTQNTILYNLHFCFYHKKQFCWLSLEAQTH